LLKILTVVNCEALHLHFVLDNMLQTSGDSEVGLCPNCVFGEPLTW